MLAEPAPSASVVIPVKDGARWLGEVLAAVLAQELGLEVLDIDSGSRDHCVDIAHAAGVSVLEIEPASFGHGPHPPPCDTSPMIARELTEFFAGFPTASVTRPSAPTSTPATSAPAGRRSASTTSPTRRTRRSLEPCAPPATGWEKAYNPRAGVLHAHE